MLAAVTVHACVATLVGGFLLIAPGGGVGLLAICLILALITHVDLLCDSSRHVWLDG